MFTRSGDDLLCTITLPMTAAALGTTVELPTLEADLAKKGNEDIETTLTLDIQAGTQSGQQLVSRGAGCLIFAARGGVTW